MEKERHLSLGFKGLKFDALIGVLPEERLSKQPLEVDLSLNVQTGAIEDHLENSVSYAGLPALVMAQADKQPLLLETLAELILEAVLALDLKIIKAEIEIRKPKALSHSAVAFVRMEKMKPSNHGGF